MRKWTVQQVIDKILEDMCGGPKISPTCDILIAGCPEQEVVVVVTIFLATFDVLK